jgi:hypothetical protein
VRALTPVCAVPAQEPLLETDPYRNSGDIQRMKSVYLDRKISATARLPKRSTIVESPAGKTVHPADMPPRQDGPSQRPTVQTVQGFASSRAAPTQARPALPGPHPADAEHAHLLRPAFARQNTGVMIVDESAPSSPGPTPDDPYSPTGARGRDSDGFTLADIPQLMEAAQAREQHRPLPRQSSTPFIADLSALQLAIVKHRALLILHRSPLRDQFELDDLLELVEVKKSGFWNKLFRPGKAQKNIKQRGVFGVPLELLVEREGADSELGATRSTLRVPSFVDDVVSAMKQMGACAAARRTSART